MRSSQSALRSNPGPPLMMKKLLRSSLVFAVLVSLALLNGCGPKDSGQKPAVEKPLVQAPPFSADSAFQFVKDQVSFGPRIPNSPAHRKAGDYMIEQLKKFGATVTVQAFEATTYDGQRLALRNIIGSYFPERQKRILLAAHWDTRPFADKDENPAAKFDGANDGASGVAVLLEMARALQAGQPPAVGVDIIFFDGEDWGHDTETWDKIGKGKPANFPLPSGLDSWWCLGSQHWSKNKHKPNYSAYYGILLDMVGAKNSHFFKEGVSMQYAPAVTNKIWKTASQLGYSSLFVNREVAGITDDHVFVNEIGKIPMVDIVHYDPALGFFGDYHHRTKDNLELISPETLEAVGRVLLAVIYSEE